MNNYEWFEARKRRRQLYIVEGNHEKNELMYLLLKCFPEIDMGLDDILIHGTNIYMLYNDIVKEYGENWWEEEVDLPFIVSKKKRYEIPLHKSDFINIILIFDYERHDPNFSEKKILKLQEYFQDAADLGKLYLNYPMVESYQHLSELPDKEYAERSVPVSLQPGYQYKNLVKDTKIAHMINLPLKLREILSNRFHVMDGKICDEFVERLLNISDTEALMEQMEELLTGVLEGHDFMTAKYQLADVLSKCEYLVLKNTYYMYMRALFNQIICHNIRKANKIQIGNYDVKNDDLKRCFQSLNLSSILKEQNIVSRDKRNVFIWVLNTCVFFVPDYNFRLLELK